MTKQEEARAFNDKLKTEKENRELIEDQNRALVKSELEKIQQNPSLAKLYADNAAIGSQNLGGTSPIMKVIKEGKSKSRLADGTRPQDGWFFYGPTQQQFQDLTVHILTISRGFRTKSLEAGKKDTFNQLLAGINIDGTNPFLIYMSGKKLTPMWEFGKIANKYTHAKPFGRPLFSLTVKLTTHMEKNSNPAWDDSWIIDFEIEKGEDNSPTFILDEKEFLFLRDKVADVEDSIESLISKIAVKDFSESHEPDSEEVSY